MSSNAFTGLMPSATDEVLKLRKEIRLRESDFTKERALLMQRVELLELELQDVQEREENQRRMHEAMINCLKKDDPTLSTSAMSAAERLVQSEIQELRNQKKKLLEEFDLKEKEYKRVIQEKEDKNKESHIYSESLILERRHTQAQHEAERKEYQVKIQILMNEKEQIGQKMELKYQASTNELQMEIERLKLEHQRELEKVKADYESSLKDIRYLHDQEKNSLENRVERSTNELKSFVSMVKTRENYSQENDSQVVRRREELEKEIQMLQNEVENIRQEWQNKNQQLTKEKDNAEKTAAKALKSLEKIKNAPRPVKIDLVSNQPTELAQKQIKNLKEEVSEYQRENEKLSEQVKKLRKEVMENQDYIEKIEQNERKARTLLKYRDNDVDSEKVEMKKLINAEKKKAIEALEASNKMRDSVEKTKNKHLSDMLEKDEKIIKLTRELRDTERKLQELGALVNNKTSQRSMSQYAFNSDQCQDANCGQGNHGRAVSYSPILSGQHLSTQQNFLFPSAHHSNSICNHGSINHQSPRGGSTHCAPLQAENQTMKQVSQLELTLLRTCQRMADSASRMECSHCFGLYETSEFYDHIISEHSQKTLAQTSILQSQTASHQSSLSINGYQSNKQHNMTHIIKKAYVEDIPGSTISQSISPRVVQSRNVPQVQASNTQKFHQNSRSFTRLLNEIEEEEKIGSTTSIINNHNITKKQKSSNNLKQEQEYKKSRNQTATVSVAASGNTIQSVLKSQKSFKKQPSTLSSARNNSSQNLTVMTACRTEIQNLKRENKKLSSRIEEQSYKIIDVSKDCQQLKKKVKKEESGKDNSKLATEIKDLIEQLVIYQGGSQVNKSGEGLRNKGLSGAFTSRQFSNIPMSMDSMIQLKSSSSSVSISGASQSNKSRQHKHAVSKSPIGHDQHLNKSQVHQHHSNKENQNRHQAKNSQKEVIRVPKLAIGGKYDENHLSSSSVDQNDTDSKCATERRYHDINTSAQHCSNSPQRYQNYFEVLQSVQDSVQDSLANKPRHSPTHESYHKLTSHRSMVRNNPKQMISRNNSNLPNVYQSKMTNNSSQHNLVLYDSSNTDIFKSKVLKKQSNARQESKIWYDSSMRKLDFEGQQQLSFDEECNDVNEDQSSRAYPSLTQYEDANGTISGAIDEDPFVTGRFCQDQAKQFVFKQSRQGSKNTTQRTHNLADH